MNRYSHPLGIAMFILFLSGSGTGIICAQGIIKPQVTNVVLLRENSKKLLQVARSDHSSALASARIKGWEISRMNTDGATMRLQKIDERGLPVYRITTNNIIAAATTRTQKLYAGGGLGLTLNGSTIAAGKIAIWDSDLPLITHNEFAGNRIEPRDETTTTALHSTHVIGTIMAAGANPVAKGMAYGLPKIYAFNFDDDTPEMSEYAPGLLISNHSYGTAAGWTLNNSVNPERWEYLGAPGENADYKFGYYNNEASEWDRICYNAPYYLPVKSAGNSRTVNGPAVGQIYYRYNADRIMSNAGPRPEGISSNDGYDNITTYGTAKNILTVGAVNPLSNGPFTAAGIILTAFSSWGPTDDGRIKPDLVADGIRITSTSNASNNAYASLSGTSMSTPNVSGSLILLQELYSQKHSGNYMRAATLKAIAIGTATDAGTAPGPDYSYGWGLLNMEAASRALLDEGMKTSVSEHVLTQGEQQFIEVTAAGDVPLLATICWTDPEAVPVSSSTALNNSSPRLINDLDLRVGYAQTTYMPWILDPSNPKAPAAKGDNTRDNVEQVMIENPVGGRNYRLRISHKGTLRRGPQPYSVVVTGIDGPASYQLTTAIDREQEMSVYPVPANTEVNVRFFVTEPSPVKMSVTNLLGQVIYTSESSNFSGDYKNLVNTSSYSPGVYFIILKVGDKSYTKKFICIR